MSWLKHPDKLIDLIKVIRSELWVIILNHFVHDRSHAFDAPPLLLHFWVDDVLTSFLGCSVSLIVLLINKASLLLEHIEQIAQCLVEKRYLNLLTSVIFLSIFLYTLLRISLNCIILSFMQLPEAKEQGAYFLRSPFFDFRFFFKLIWLLLL